MTTTYIFLCKDNTSQQLILQTFHCDSEINDWCSSTDLFKLIVSLLAF
jgi:hypothetical protein